MASEPERRRRRRRRLALGAAVALAIVAAAGGALYALRDSDGDPRRAAPTTAPAPSTTAPAPRQPVRLLAVGDLFTHSDISGGARQPDGSYNFVPMFAAVQPIVAQGDVRFCNQESPSAGNERGITGYPVFNSPTEFVAGLHAFGCNVVNLANNHVGDKGMDGLARTLDTWAALPPIYAINGANRIPEEQRVAYFDVKGVRFAFVGFAEFSNQPVPPFAVNMLDAALVARLVDEASANAEFVIVSAHWGTEDSSQVNPHQELLAQLMADHGADLVIGTGPHVLQSVARVPSARGGEALVWYSLGNFLSGQVRVAQQVGGIAMVELVPGDRGLIASGVRFLPTYMDRTNRIVLPLAQAHEALGREHADTNVDEQLQRVTAILNERMPLEVVLAA
jgi:poly-gamma-glutamate capsule biosynthesis protein CapA/YwtB (metallophosphatase superfamily)